MKTKHDILKALEGLFCVIIKNSRFIIANNLLRSIISIYRRAYWKTKLSSLGEGSFIYPKVVIHNKDCVKIGSYCIIAEFVHIWGGCGVRIGNNVLIASHVVITSSTHLPEERPVRKSLVTKSVVIEDNVWIGTHAIILPGVTIKSGAVVAAGAVVTKDVPMNVVVAGVPASIIRVIDT